MDQALDGELGMPRSQDGRIQIDWSSAVQGGWVAEWIFRPYRAGI